jgi:hypothetical protein
MDRTVRILVQTTTPHTRDDWSIDSLSMLIERLTTLREDGTRFEVTARNRDAPPTADDPVLSTLDRSSFDELWLFALDGGDGLTAADCRGIGDFRRRGGGVLTTRDHNDMGSSLRSLGGVGAAHHFHSHNVELDTGRQAPDDRDTPSISWPNYHSGRNGDYQRIVPVDPPHELLRRSDGAGLIELLPSHPHEGAVGVPSGDRTARVVARGTSVATGRPFNLIVAFERSRDVLGRGVAESSFHHFADYNWDTSRGAPSFVTEPEGEGMQRDPRALRDVGDYVRNLAFWLAPPA